MRTSQYIDIVVQVDRGTLRVVAVRKGRFSAGPTVIPRFRGRYELKIYAHGLMRDVVRFNMPLSDTAGTAATAGAAARRSGQGASLASRMGLGLERGVKARLTVRAPFDRSVTRAEIFDSKSGTTTKVDLSGVVLARPGIKAPTNLRTRSIRKAAPTTLADCLVLFKGKPKRIKDCEKKARASKKKTRKKKKDRAPKRLEDAKILQ